MTGWTRRAVLGAGALGALAACTPDGDPSPRPSATPTATRRPTGPAAGGPDWDRLRRSVQGTLARPDDPAYDQVRLLQNPRYDGERPLAVLSVASERDVATAIPSPATTTCRSRSGRAGTAIPAGPAAGRPERW